MSPKIPDHPAVINRLGNAPISGESAASPANPVSPTTFPNADVVSSEAVWDAARSANGSPTVGLGIPPGADIEALAFTVMMEATKSAQDDLKSIMDGVKTINAQKDQLRSAQESETAAAAEAEQSSAQESEGTNPGSNLPWQPSGAADTSIIDGLRHK